MKLIIHDLSSELAEKILPHDPDIKIIANDSPIHPCVGCFGCWIKTPGQCVIKDQYACTGELLSKCDEVIIISKCCYGGFSPFVKNVLDRAISYIHPYFVYRNGEMHHKHRYSNSFNLFACFYGEDITDSEKQTAKNLVQANSINFDCKVKNVLFEKQPEAFGGKTA